MALNVATLPLMLCRKVKTIKHGSVRTLWHFPIPCFLTFCSAISTTFFISNELHVLVYDNFTKQRIKAINFYHCRIKAIIMSTAIILYREAHLFHKALVTSACVCVCVRVCTVKHLSLESEQHYT